MGRKVWGWIDNNAGFGVGVLWLGGGRDQLLDILRATSIAVLTHAEYTKGAWKKLLTLTTSRAKKRRWPILLTVLVQHFEEVRYPLSYPLRHTSPIDALRDLMEVRNLRHRDLIPIFGARSVVSEVISGKRTISKNHPGKLVEFFHVPVRNV
jgi:antitoxin component HigA of HigAB toxin-antitoxin module